MLFANHKILQITMRIIRALLRGVGLSKRTSAEQLASALAALDQEWSLSAFDTVVNLAKGGNASSQYQLAQIYEEARGVVQNLADAVHWYQQAAEQGHLLSQARLGLIYSIQLPPAAAITLQVERGLSEHQSESKRRINTTQLIPLGGTLLSSFNHGFSVDRDMVEAAKWNRLAAEGGIAESQARFGHQLALGLGVETDLDAAAEWFEASALQANVDGTAGLGMLLLGAYGGQKDLNAALPWLRQAAEAGSAIAQHELGVHLLSKTNAQDTAEALRFLLAAANGGYKKAMLTIGLEYWKGKGLQRDPDQAITWLRRAAVRGDMDAMRALGQLLLEQAEEDENPESVDWLRRAADAGDVKSAGILSALLLRGKGGLPFDPLQAAHWLSASGAIRSGADSILLASYLLETENADTSFGTASEWLDIAAHGGNVAAIYNLGSINRLGKGIEQNDSRALEWYAIAAARGNSQAAFYLGVMYGARGDLIEDHSHAAHWFEQAAGGMHSLAICNFGLAHIRGKGRPRDATHGLCQLEDAALHGSVEAAEVLSELFEDGKHFLRSPKLSLHYLSIAVNLGSRQAAVILARRNAIMEAAA